MGNSILAGFMVFNAGACDKTGFLGPVRKQDGEDSFYSIFEEKLRGIKNSGDKSQRAPSVFSHGKPETPQKETLNQVRSPDAENYPAAGKADNVADRGITSEAARSIDEPDPKDIPEEEKSEETKRAELLDEMALLLETLLVELDTLLPGCNASDEGTTEGMAVKDVSLEALRAMMGGRLDRLQELLDQVRSMGKDGGQGETLALLDQIEALISRIQQKGTSQDSSTSPQGVATVEKDGEACEDLIAQLQSQCREIADKLRADKAGAAKPDQTSELHESRETALNLVPDEADASQKEGKSLSSDDTSPKAKKAGADASGKAHGSQSENTQAMGSTQATEGPDSIPQNQQVVHAGPPQVDAQNVKTDKMTFYLPDKQVSQTVTNQVAMKIKLMAGENKQELEMHLKPDSLGKLTLKIIHEQGEVLARITAENEQVKSILESNMQLLKDSLEKNGFSVQSLDVSVGNQNNENQSTHQHGQDRRDGAKEPDSSRPVGRTLRRVAESNLYGMGLPGDAQQIDLTA